MSALYLLAAIWLLVPMVAGLALYMAPTLRLTADEPTTYASVPSWAWCRPTALACYCAAIAVALTVIAASRVVERIILGRSDWEYSTQRE